MGKERRYFDKMTGTLIVERTQRAKQALLRHTGFMRWEEAKASNRVL